MSDSYKSAGILFFDVHNYSNLNDLQMKSFHEKVWPDLHKLVIKENDDFLYMNTWGDGIVLLHEDYVTLAKVALNIRDYFNHVDYSIYDGLDLELSARIAIHHDEFLQCMDPFQSRRGYYGLEIVRCARIEPKITPGHVWCTETVKIDIQKRFRRQGLRVHPLEFRDRGMIELAKAFATEKIWEIVRPGEKDK